MREEVGVAALGLSSSVVAEVAAPFRNPHPSYEFQRGLGEILGAVLQAGLTLGVSKE